MIDKQAFQGHIENVLVQDTNVGVHELADSVCDVLYNCGQKSLRRGQVSARDDVHLSRWERLLNDKDDTRVWKAVNWNGEIDSSVCANDVIPSDEEFKAHFEEILNQGNYDDNSLDSTTSHVNIPILDEPICN